MKQLTVLTLAACVGMALALPAHAADTDAKGGTVKGAVVGGVAGHMLGGHAATGAAVGAVAGHHERAKSQASINSGGKP